ncbi:MAG: Rv3235 family protein [Nostocoides sp.]
MSDSTVIRIRPIPESRPPECHKTHAELMAEQEPTAYIQDALAVDFTAQTDDQLFGIQPTTRRDLPDPHAWAAHVGQAVVEILAGTRNPVQLVRWTTPEVYTVLARRATVVQRRLAESPDARPASRRPAVVRRVLLCEPADGVAEATVIVVHGNRVRALAMRFVGQDGRWRLTVARIG